MLRQASARSSRRWWTAPREVRPLSLLGSPRPEWEPHPQWKREGNAITCNMAFKSGVMLSGRAAMEPDGIRLNHTDLLRLGCSLAFDYSFFPDSFSCRFSFFRAALACLISSLA